MGDVSRFIWLDMSMAVVPRSSFIFVWGSGTHRLASANNRPAANVTKYIKGK